MPTVKAGRTTDIRDQTAEGADAAAEQPLPPEAVLLEIAELLISERSPERVLDAVADAVAQLIPHDTLTVYQANPLLKVHHPVLVRDLYAEQIEAMGNIPFGQGITGKVAESRVPQLVNDAHLDERAHQVPGTPVEPESLIAIPLLARGELKGILCIYRLGDQNHFSDEEFALAIRFGKIAALAIDNAETRMQLEKDVVTDHLTGLFNHRYFHERLAEEVRRSNRLRSPVAILVYDIDDFKQVNDAHGHLVGDQVLRTLSVVSRDTCRQEDLVCRIGGEEFTVILPGSDEAAARRLADRLVANVGATPFPEAGRVTVSVGVAAAPQDSSGPRELFACADLALRRAKSLGKNRVCAFADLDRTDEDAGRRPSKRPRRGQPERRVSPVLAARGELRSVAELRMLRNLSMKLNTLNDVAQIGEAVAAELRGLVDYHNCRVYLLDDAEQMLIPIAFRGQLSEYEGETYEALLTKMGEGITGTAATTGRTMYAPNASTSDVAVQIAGTADIEESILAVPLSYGDRVTGVLVLSKLGVDQFDEEDTRLLEALASNLAIALESARLLESERQARATLEEAYLSTIEALANAVEAKDEYTSDHCRALAGMSLAVGQELGIEGDRLKHLELGALFHDIGKIGVASDIIRKPGPLTASERREMNRHPEVGAQILAPVPFLKPVRPIVEASHERWDGGGYPKGLTGENIPLESRIVFVCDAFHAMTTDRPYRSALPPKEAFRRLRLASGTQFDPAVVKAFLALHAGGRELRTNEA